MEKRIYIATLTVALIGLFAAVPAKAQLGNQRLTASIPFEFMAGNKTLPAGEYVVRQMNGSSRVLHLRSKDGRANAMVQVIPVTGGAQKNAKLIFHRYGNRYFFAQAWTVGESSGLETPKTRRERAIERELAGLKAANAEVALVLNSLAPLSTNSFAVSYLAQSRGLERSKGSQE